MLKDGHVPPQAHILEGSPNAPGGDLVGAQPDDIASHKDNPAIRRLVDACDQVENCGLASTVRTNQALDLTLIDFKLKVVYGS